LKIQHIYPSGGSYPQTIHFGKFFSQATVAASQRCLSWTVKKL